MQRFALLLSVSLLACSGSTDEPAPAVEQDTGLDTGVAVQLDTGVVIIDSMSESDSTTTDTAVSEVAADTAVSEVAADTAAEVGSDASGCHSVAFGAPAAPITKVTMLSAPTGGTIPAGIYDAVEVKTTGSITGTYRATWSFSATAIEAIEQLTISPTPPAPSVRTFSYTTAGASFSRTMTCGGSMMFSNTFTVRTEAAVTFLDIRQDTIQFTFKKR